MTKQSFILRNAVKTVAVLAVIALSSSAMAQTFQYTDASGVNYTFEPTIRDGVDIVKLTTFTLPSSVTKWVMPETVTNNNVTYRFTDITAYTWDEYNLRSATLREIVFPNSMTHAGGRVSNITFPQLHKVTFGKNVSFAFTDFVNVQLDTIIFLGTGIIWGDGSGGTELYNAFDGCPATTKIFIPCGTMQQFLTAFANSYTTWDEDNGWTTANFIESPCLNTLIVLSSNNALGNAYSFAGCGFVTQTPDNTSANFSGIITLLALPEAGKVFVGWNDGNLENPRVVNVASDVTYTAQFATCSALGVEDVQASAPLKVFPNPVSNGQFTLSNGQGKAEIYTVQGVQVGSYSLTDKETTINVSHLANGVYFVKTGNTTRKLVVNK